MHEKELVATNKGADIRPQSKFSINDMIMYT